jgi:hypothetical protein
MTSATRTAPRPVASIPPGTPVEVRNRFDGAWAGGFVVLRSRTDERIARYEIQRTNDGTILPDLFPDDLVRVEPRT